MAYLTINVGTGMGGPDFKHLDENNVFSYPKTFDIESQMIFLHWNIIRSYGHGYHIGFKGSIQLS